MAHSHHRHSFFCLGAVHARQVCGGAEGKERAHAYLSASVAKCTVMGGQQVCNQACRPCNESGVTVTAQ